MFDPNKRLNAQKSLAHPYFDDIINNDSQDSGISSQTTNNTSFHGENIENTKNLQQDTNSLSSDELFPATTTDSGISLGDTASGSESRTLTRTDSGICVSPTPILNENAPQVTECCVNNNVKTEATVSEQKEEEISSPPRKMQRRSECI